MFSSWVVAQDGMAIMAVPSRGERLQIMLTEEELRAVDDWRFERRMPSRAAAVRELLRRGLTAEGFLSAESGRKSESFSVVEQDGTESADGHAQDALAGEGQSRSDD